MRNVWVRVPVQWYQFSGTSSVVPVQWYQAQGFARCLLCIESGFALVDQSSRATSGLPPIVGRLCHLSLFQGKRGRASAGAV